MAVGEIVRDFGNDRKTGIDAAGMLVHKGAIAWGSTPVELTVTPAELNELGGNIPAVAVAAAGAGQATFTALTSRNNAVTGADGTKGVALPAAATSVGWVMVTNTSATAVLNVAPVNGGNDAINGLTAGTGVFALAPGMAALFIPTSATQWYTAHWQGQTPGTATASLPLIPDANKDLASLRDVTVRAIKVGDSANDHTIAIQGAGDEAANRTLSIPLLGGNDTIATRGLANAFTARQTTTDGVASGTAKVIGGRATANVAAADTVTAATSNNSFVAFATTYVIPANTLGVGSVLRARALVVVNDASGTDTLTVEMRIGGTTLIATTAVDPGATTDLHQLDFEFTARAAAGAAASCVGCGRWITNTGGTIAHGTGLLAPSNFATNGALTLDVRAKWSSNTASTSARLEMLNVWID